MDARKYASKNIRPDNVRDAPIQARIVNAFEEDRYSRLCLELETGAEFPLNDGNTNILIKAWGHNTDEWIGLEVELYLGTYKDWRADPPEEKGNGTCARSLAGQGRREWRRADRQACAAAEQNSRVEE